MTFSQGKTRSSLQSRDLIWTYHICAADVDTSYNYQSINQSINQSKHISIAPYVATNQRRMSKSHVIYKRNTTFRPITGNKYSTLLSHKEVNNGLWELTERPDLKLSCNKWMDITPLRICISVMNCFNELIFFVSVTNLNFAYCPGMGKCSGYQPVSKSEFRKKWT